MTITRMQEPRQLYGLGSLVKKITKPIKKIVKSPIGKAALLIGGAGLAGFGPAAGMSEAEIEETKRDPDKLRIYLKDYFSKLNPNASDEDVEQFVETTYLNTKQQVDVLVFLKVAITKQNL